MCWRCVQRLLSLGSEGAAVFSGNYPRGHGGEDDVKKKKRRQALIRDESPASASALKLPPLGWEAASNHLVRLDSSFSLVRKYIYKNILIQFMHFLLWILFSDVLVAPSSPVSSSSAFLCCLKWIERFELNRTSAFYGFLCHLTEVYFSLGGRNIVSRKSARTFPVSLCVLVLERLLRAVVEFVCSSAFPPNLPHNIILY